jgi:hypothetical protein
MTRRSGRHCTAPTACVPRALRNRDWKAEAAKAKADKAAAEKAAADKAAADKAMAAFPWYGSGLGVFSHFPLS